MHTFFSSFKHRTFATVLLAFSLIFTQYQLFQHEISHQLAHEHELAQLDFAQDHNSSHVVAEMCELCFIAQQMHQMALPFVLGMPLISLFSFLLPLVFFAVIISASYLLPRSRAPPAIAA